MKKEVKNAYSTLPEDTQKTCLYLRELISVTSKQDSRIGPLTETLKWKEPAYLTSKTKSGSTLRVWKTKSDERPALFVNCKTTLIQSFKEMYPSNFEYRDNRALVIHQPIDEKIKSALQHCIILTLTYHLKE